MLESLLDKLTVGQVACAAMLFAALRWGFANWQRRHGYGGSAPEDDPSEEPPAGALPDGVYPSSWRVLPTAGPFLHSLLQEDQRLEVRLALAPGENGAVLEPPTETRLDNGEVVPTFYYRECLNVPRFAPPAEGSAAAALLPPGKLVAEIPEASWGNAVLLRIEAAVYYWNDTPVLINQMVTPVSCVSQTFTLPSILLFT